MITLTQERLKEVIHYNPDTGDFTWIIPTGSNCSKGGLAGGSGDKDGYYRIAVDNSRFGAHRLAFLYMIGEFPVGMVDHIDRNPSNNKWDNLREADKRLNTINTVSKCNNTSGVIGVSYDKGHKKYEAFITHFKKRRHLGYHKELYKAAIARYKGEIKYGFNLMCNESSAYRYLKDNGYITSEWERV